MELIADNISPDVIIFDGGSNDIGGNITIGDISEAKDNYRYHSMYFRWYR